MGLPTTSETATADGIGRYNDLAAKGYSIYWSPATVAEVHGAIGQRWRSLGAERSRLRYPTRDEYAVPGGRRSEFQGGTVTWTASTGALRVQYW